MSNSCDTPDNCPWICHVCDYTGTGEGTACSICYKLTCRDHLRHLSILNRESGLYEIRPVCLYCMASEG